MMDAYPFEKLVIRPHWMQFCIGEIHWMLLAAVLMTAYLMTSFLFHNILAYLAWAIIIFLLYRMLYISRIQYIVTEEQIMYLHGILSHQTDYMELYRVVDYQQNRTFMQQLTRLKTITIMSGDRNMPVLNIIGVREDEDLVQEIRRRLDYNKKQKSIYEITNRM